MRRTATHGRSSAAVFVGYEGVLTAVREAGLWLLPLCRVAAYAALLRDRRRTGLVLTVLAALPSLTPAVDWAAGPTATLDGYDVAFAASGWPTVLAVGCAFHGDAPRAQLPAVPPGLALLSLVVLAERTGMLVLFAQSRMPASYLYAGGAQALALAVLAVGLGVAGTRLARRGREPLAARGESGALE